jgi:hypothetical protein
MAGVDQFVGRELIGRPGRRRGDAGGGCGGIVWAAAAPMRSSLASTAETAADRTADAALGLRVKFIAKFPEAGAQTESNAASITNQRSLCGNYDG